MIRVSRQALSTFGTDAGKAMLVTAVPCLVLDWILLDPTRAGVFAFFFVMVGILVVPLGLFAVAAVALFLTRRPGWLLGPVLMLVLHEALHRFVY